MTTDSNVRMAAESQESMDQAHPGFHEGKGLISLGCRGARRYAHLIDLPCPHRECVLAYPTSPFLAGVDSGA